jgi:exodeoxyribonuclease VII large subunit
VVVRAIAACPVPTIAAVGHESDVTLADFVADARAPTPSAAAEMVLARKDEVYSRIDRLARRLESAIGSRRGRLESRLRTLENRPGLAGFHARVAMRGRHAVELRSALHHGIRRRLSADRRVLGTLSTRLDALDVRYQLASVRRRLDAHRLAIDAHVARRRQGAKSRLATAVGRLEALSPLAVLARGYALCWTDDRATVIRQASQVRTGDTVRVRLGEGELRCDVRE